MCEADSVDRHALLPPAMKQLSASVGGGSYRRLARQLSVFVRVGVLAAAIHYGVLIGLVEGIHLAVVPATLIGFTAGGVVSYLLHRRHTFASDRPHQEAGWRFALVAGIGFGLTGLFMHLFVDRLGAPYLPAQLLTTGLVLVWTFLANKLWTFGAPAA
jgi:putative flippase GtrA